MNNVCPLELLKLSTAVADHKSGVAPVLLSCHEWHGRIWEEVSTWYRPDKSPVSNSNMARSGHKRRRYLCWDAMLRRIEANKLSAVPKGQETPRVNPLNFTAHPAELMV